MTYLEAREITAQGFNGYVDFSFDDGRVLLDGMFTSKELLALATMLDREKVIAAEAESDELSPLPTFRD